MKRVLIFVGLKVLEILVGALVIALLFALVALHIWGIVQITNGDASWYCYLLLILPTVFVVFCVGGAITMISQDFWSWVQDNWRWAGEIEEKINHRKEIIHDRNDREN